MRLRPSLLIALTLALPAVASAQRDSTFVAKLHTSTDSLVRLDTTVMRSWCALKGTTATRKTACVTLARLHQRIAADATAFWPRVAPAPTPAPTPTPTPTPNPAPAPAPDSTATVPAGSTGIVPNVSTTGAIVAEVPRAIVNSAYPTVTRVVTVPAGADLQAAINAARAGDELRLSDGATWIGNVTLPNRSDTGTVVIRAAGSLPSLGTRMTPSMAATLRLPKLLTPNYSEVIGTAIGAHGWRLDGIEVGPATSMLAEVNMLVRLGYSDATQTTLAQVPRNLVIARSYIHGSPTMKTARCVTLNSGATAIVDNWLSDCRHSDKDSQGLWGSNGPGPFTIINNHVEGGHQALFFGGASPNIPGLTPSDIYATRNHFTRPLSWRCSGPRQPDGLASCLAGETRTKTLIEVKHARRMLLEGNVIENVWSDAQDGFGILLKAEDQDGRARWTTARDLTLRNNLIRRVANGFNLSASPGWAPIDSGAARITITGNLIESFGMGGEERAYQFAGITDATVAHNTTLNTKSTQFISLTGGVSNRFTFDANVGYPGMYGIHSDDGTPRTPGAAWRTNVLIGGAAYPFSCSSWPATTLCPAAPLTTYPLGFDGKPIGADTAAVNAATAGVMVNP